MAEAVALVDAVHVAPRAVRVFKLDVGVEIAVGPLGLLDEADRLVQVGAQRLIRMGGERVGAGLGPLVDVAIVEHEADVASRLARHDPAEVLQARRQLIPLVGQRRLDQRPLPARPEGVDDAELRKRKRPHAAGEGHAERLLGRQAFKSLER